MKWRNFQRGCGVLALLLLWPSLGAAVIQGTMVAGGCTHSLVIRADGTLWAWGANGYGQLGLGDTTLRLHPTRVGGPGWVAVAAGFEHSLAIRADGTFWAWGDNVCGQLGLGDTTDRNTPTQVRFPALPWLPLLLLD